MAFEQRVRIPEIQDQLDLAPQPLGDALRGLERIHWFSQTAAHLWRPVAELARALHPAPVRILDIACGSGWLLRDFHRRAGAAGLNLELAGCDLNPVTVDYAQEQNRRAGLTANLFTFDARRDEPPPGYDVLLSCTFLHHLDDADAGALLKGMRQNAGRLVVVDDLIRSRFGWWLAHLGTRALLTGWVNRIDGPRSVCAAFTLAEMRRLGEQAGMDGASLEPHWPCRFLLCWKNTHAKERRQGRPGAVAAQHP